MEWEKLQKGSLKFNVHGAARGCPRPAGVRGILRDSSGEVKVIFSKSIGTADSNLAEILEIREAFLIFLALQWREHQQLIIESDSSNAVKWTTGVSIAPWKMRKWLLQMERMKKGLFGWEIRHVLREANQRADTLAKGVLLQADIVTALSGGVCLLFLCSFSLAGLVVL
ncbi:uncharacterized protein LOC110421389 [Herrania umbratica]|uniref:Uncharacterized protein LOC110421389 n=1 Tax=Herrania umbratica TaxID=108875 RepID=A0A6J1AUP6_9ROSI|nr:uncharacterized protein LOC110421389 [Herrania umbratica]